MNLKKRLAEINARKVEIRSAIEGNTEIDLDQVETELASLEEEVRSIEKKLEVASKIAVDEQRGQELEKPEGGINVFENRSREDILAGADYRSGFFKALQGKELSETEKRDYTSAAGSAGAAIPTETQDLLFQKMQKLAPMLGEITLLRVAGNVTFAVENVRDAAAQHSQNGAITPASDSLVSVTLTGYEFNKVIRISKTVSTMSINAFEGWLTDMLAEDLARVIENAIINGTGSNQPQGVASLGWTATNAITTTASFTYDNVVDLIALLPAAYDPNAKFLTHKKTLYGNLAKIKDTTGEPILVKDMEKGLSFNLMGYPVIISDKVVVDELYLGDFKKIVGNLAQDITVESSVHSGFLNNAIDYRGGAIFDSKVGLAEAFVRIKK